MAASEATDIWGWLLALMGTGGGGAIALAFFGWLKAKAERPPHIAPPSVGSNGMAQIAGMVMGQTDLQALIDALRAISASHDRCTLAREAEMASHKKEVEETRDHEKRLLEERRTHEKRLAEDQRQEHREMVEALNSLTSRVRDIRCAS